MLIQFLTACEGEQEVAAIADSEYFALQTGKYQIYDVNEVRYTVSADPITVKYQLKAEVVDSFASGPNIYTYVIHRSTRESEADSWTSLDTWSARREDGALIVSEGNTPYVKLRTPLAHGNTWNGNLFNTIGEDEYGYSNIGQSIEINGISFGETLTVEQENNEDSIVFRDERNEVYARNVGLVYKEFIQLHYCTADACLGQQKVDEGIERTMVINEYGKH